MTNKTEAEQVEDLKRWWEQNGKWVVIVLVLGVSGFVGGTVWNNHQLAQKVAASAKFDAVFQLIDNGQDEQAMAEASKLIEQYRETDYAAGAALALAKLQSDKKDYDAARLHLQWILDNSQNAEMKNVASLRLARLLLAQQKLDEALALANPATPGAYAAAFAMMRGEILQAKGDKAAARIAYQAALDSKTISPQTRDAIRMKMDELTVVTEAS